MEQSSLGRVRIFEEGTDGFRPVADGSLVAGDARLAIEAVDIVRDDTVWDGAVTITATGARGGADSVTMQVAPLLHQNHTQPSTRVLLAPSTAARPFLGKQGEAMARAGRQTLAFFDDLHRRRPLPEAPAVLAGDEWVQDYLDVQYVSMPGPTGKLQTMHLIMLSDEQRQGQAAVFELQGRDVGVLRPGDKPGRGGPQDGFGNYETIPPYTVGDHDYPAGRVVYGATAGIAPTERMIRLLESQGVRDPIAVDTSWLSAGHVDEFIQFLPAPDTDRGWRIAVADPQLAWRTLQRVQSSGHGDQPGASTPRGIAGDEYRSADRERVPGRPTSSRRHRRDDRTRRGQPGDHRARDRAHRRGDRPDTLLFKIELVAQPGDSPPAEHYGGLLPNAINGLLYDPTTVVFPRQFGPRVDGVDVMERAVERAYGRAGLDARSIDTSLTYHPGGGEIHCGTNTFRDVSAPWWR